MPQTQHFGAVRGRSPSAPTPSWPWLAYLGAPSLHRGRRSRPGCAAAAPCSSHTSGEALDLCWGSVSLPVSGTISCRTHRVHLAAILSPCPAWACRLAPALSTRLAQTPRDRDSDAGPLLQISTSLGVAAHPDCVLSPEKGDRRTTVRRKTTRQERLTWRGGGWCTSACSPASWHRGPSLLPQLTQPSCLPAWGRC